MFYAQELVCTLGFPQAFLKPILHFGWSGSHSGMNQTQLQYFQIPTLFDDSCVDIAQSRVHSMLC